MFAAGSQVLVKPNFGPQCTWPVPSEEPGLMYMAFDWISVVIGARDLYEIT